MASIKQQSIKPKNCRPKLFSTHSPTNKSLEFQQMLAKFKKNEDQDNKKHQAEENTKATACTNKIYQNKDGQTHEKKLELKESRNDLAQKELKTIRAFSSKKFDCPQKKVDHKKSSKFIQHLREYAKTINKTQSSSKKSTDDSNSSELAKIKEENYQIRDIIKREQLKALELQKKIVQEDKKHELQKQLYQHGIRRLLRKLSGNEAPLYQILQLHQSFLSNNEQEDCDSLSIESN